MPGYWFHGRRSIALHQARAGLPLALCAVLAACADPVAVPVDLFHDLEGGEIAAHRPPPPGATDPYPKIGTVPAKPAMPDPAFRTALRAQLQEERDRKERIAADAPIIALPPPQPAPPTPHAAAATIESAEAKPARAAQPVIQPAPATPPSGPVTIAGDPFMPAVLPDLPPAPPAPASFEDVPAQPTPTEKRIVLPALPTGTAIFFADGSDSLSPSQLQVLKDIAANRGKAHIDIIGQGAATDDSPEGQQTAILLALSRAKSVAAALTAQFVPQTAISISAEAFGRGAVLRLSK